MSSKSSISRSIGRTTRVRPNATAASPATRAAVIVYFFARLAHFLVYTAGIPLMRTVAFTVGWVAQLVVIASILRWI